MTTSKKCETCGKKFEILYPSLSKRKYCSKKCARLGHNPIRQDVGHRHIDDMGHGLRYWVIKCEDGKWRREHRVIMEKKLGRKLNRNEHVHHKDGNGLNNNEKNLELMAGSEHARITFKKRMHPCPLCQHLHIPGGKSKYHVCPDCGRSHQIKQSH